jgi:septation ring formation regulator EzrA
MRKSKTNRSKHPAPDGYIAKLEHMVDRSVARKRITHGSPPVREGFDTFFDMIDSRLTKMLTRSSTIDEKLENLEFKSRSGSRITRSVSPSSRIRKTSPKKTLKVSEELPSLEEVISALSAEINAVRQEQQILSNQVADLRKAVFG